jgi:hypothetical protein
LLQKPASRLARRIERLQALRTVQDFLPRLLRRRRTRR